ncbi:MAG: acyl-CoA dehydrogenase family protein [Aeromicrobium sp.]
MTATIEDRVSTAGADALARAKELAALVASEAGTTEANATISQPVLDALAEARLHWAVVPTELGGLGLSMTDGMRISEEIARADGSTGWSFMATAFSTSIIGGFIDEKGAADLFGGDDRPAIAAGMLLPRGTCKRVEGGYLVDGNWSFASGSAFANWIGVGFLVAGDDGAPIVDDNGLPEARIALLPREQIEFKGGWNVWGLVGTGSYDYSVHEQFVPEHHTLLTFAPTPVRSEPIYAFGTLGMGVLGHGAVALGVAQRALEEVASIVATKVRPGQTQTVGESPLFAYDFARQEAYLQAARLYVYDIIGQAEATAATGQPLSAETFARFRQSVTWLHEVAKGVVDFAHHWAGSASIRDNTAIGRCVRDINVATQHVLVDPSSLSDATAEILPGYRA